MRNTKHKKGQALLFVLVAVSVAMVVGVSISNRTLSSVKRTTTSDTYSRVLGAAEGCIERAVVLPLTDVDTLVNGGVTNAECTTAFGNVTGIKATTDGTACVLPYAAPGENLNLIAEATFQTLTGQNRFDATLVEGKMLEISLGSSYTGGSVDLCWENPNSAISAVVYNATTVARTGYKVDGNSNLADTAAFIPTDRVIEGFACKSVNFGSLGASSPFGLRLKALYEGTDIRVYPVSPLTLPNQGYSVTCKGLLSGPESQSISKTITAVKTNPSIPSIFDYGLYSHDGSIQVN